MDRFAVFVDAGYFFAAGSQAAFGAKVSRRELTLRDHRAAISDVVAKAKGVADGQCLLRIYWYDAMPGPRRSLEQSQLSMLAGVKLRLGVLNSNGEQKGVDSLIVTDLVELARNGAISDAVLIAGDEDLRIAVELAQSFGVRVHLLAAGEARNNVSATLQMEADSVTELEPQWFAKILEQNATERVPASPVAAPACKSPVVTEPAGPVATEPLSFEQAGNLVIAELLESDASQVERLAIHFLSSTSVPSEFDGRLIAKTGKHLERHLSGEEKRAVRGMFVTAVRAEASKTLDFVRSGADSTPVRSVFERTASADSPSK